MSPMTSRHCDVISSLLYSIADGGDYVGHDAPKLMTVSHTDPQLFSTKKTITPTIKARLITAYASENAIMFAPPSDQSLYTRVSSSPKSMHEDLIQCEAQNYCIKTLLKVYNLLFTL